MNLLLRNLRCHGATTTYGDVRIRRGRIVECGRGLRRRWRERVLDGSGLLALPGLINAHDHLSLNLLPHLGTPPYPNLYAFAEINYRPEESPIRELMLETHVRDRLWWGAYKNLISGVTTVAHHDPFTRRVFHRWFPVRLVRRYGWSHSLGFDERPEDAFGQSDGPFIIHAAEGIDPRSEGEIDELDRRGVLSPRTVLVHAIAVSQSQRQRLVATGSRVVWCPFSNLRLYGQTADIPAYLDAGIPTALGTDSTMSGAATLLDEARTASASGLADDERILAMVTTEAARVYDLDDGRGTLAPGAPADLVLIPDHRETPGASLLDTQPADIALTLIGGAPRRAAPQMAEALGLGPPNARVDGAPTWLYGDVTALRGRLLRDAGADALGGNPVWHRLTGIDDPTATAVPSSAGTGATPRPCHDADPGPAGLGT